MRLQTRECKVGDGGSLRVAIPGCLYWGKPNLPREAILLPWGEGGKKDHLIVELT